MLFLALTVITCLLVRGGTGQFQEVQPSFCSSSQLVGAQCDDTMTDNTPAPETLESQVNVLRCQSGCLMNEQLNILDGYPVSEEVWTSINPDNLDEAQQVKLDACRRQCIVFTVIPGFTELVCQLGCRPTLTEDEEACRIGCSLGNMLFIGKTADDPAQVPAQPTGTPPIFFDVESSRPWEFSLNLSAVVPESTTQLQPNRSNPVDSAGRPLISGFLLQITIEQNGVNTTYYYHMFDPAVPGSLSFSTFLSSLRCHEMYLSIGVVNFYGMTNLTEPTQTCIPGPYSLIMEPRLVVNVPQVRQGPPDNPSLGTIALNWQPPESSPIFGYPTYEVSASYIRSSNDLLNSRCQPNGGNEEFRQGNLSDITSFEIESGPHGNIQLLPQNIGPCVYNVTLEAVWVGPSVAIPFLRTFRRIFPREVDIVFVPDDQPFVRVAVNISNVRSDGFYNFDTIEVQLDPPISDFYESFNGMIWGVTLFDGFLAQFSAVLPPVIEPNPQNFSVTNFRFPPPEEIRNLTLSPLRPNSVYDLTVEPIRVNNDRFPDSRRDYLRLPNERTVRFDSSMATPIPPGPLRNVTITGCSVMESASLQVAWELPEMSFGMLVNCSFNISIMEETVENATLVFVPGASQNPETRGSSLPLPTGMTYSSFLFSVEMMCVNIHGLSTPLSTTDSFNGSGCVVVDPPTPSASPTTSVVSPTPTIRPSSPPGPVFRTEYYIAIGAAVGLLVALLLIVILVCCYCVWMQRRKHHMTQLWEMKRTRSLLRKVRVSAVAGDEWELDPNHLYMKEKLGEGNFGEVYQAVIAGEVECVKAKKYVDDMAKLDNSPPACTVAVKLLKTNAPGETRQSFLNEINMMKKVAGGNCVNVVRMVGCVSVQSPYALVLEYVPYGSLLDYLRENRKLTQKRRQLKRMMQLAKETSRKRNQQLSGSGDGAAGSAGGFALPVIAEGSLHSLDSASAHYLSHSELNPGGSSGADSCFSHSAPESARKSPVLLEYGGERAEGNDYLGVEQFDEARVSPYEEPIQLGFLPKASDLGHDRPASYIQPISSPTQLLPLGGSQKSDDSEPQALTMETSGHQNPTSSSAMNPLYEDPEIKNPYPDLGELEAVNLMMFAYQIASGMEYLASLGIVHRDLACRNVLVDRDKILKISDFGLSRETDLYVSSSQGRLPLRWMSPEAILDRVFTEKSDVWAYGITIWEICTLGGYPYALTPNSELLQSLLEGYRMEQPDNCSEQIYRIMNDCWHIDPMERPLFKTLKSDLDRLLMVHQPDECIKFSEIDEEKLPYYRKGASTSEHSGGSNEDDTLLTVPKLLNSYTPSASMRSARSTSRETTSTTTQLLVPAEIVRVGNGSTPRVIPISPQSSAGTIKDDDEKQRNDHDDDELAAEPSDTALTAQSSASTIRDDSGSEETKL